MVKPASTEPRRWLHRLAVSAGILMFWVLLAWFLANTYRDRQIAEVIRTEQQQIHQHSQGTATSVRRILSLRGTGVAITMAQNGFIRDSVLALLRDRQRMSSSINTLEQRQERLLHHPVTQKLRQYLVLAASQFQLSSLWVGDANGDCLASGRQDVSHGCVGTNYADRFIFQEARAGRSNYQFAVGRLTGVGGLFFGAPIEEQGRFIGFVVAKIDMPDLSSWINQAHAFLSDRYGVVVLAYDKSLEMHTLPGAAIHHLTAIQRQQTYKRDAFPPLALEPWNTPIFGEANHTLWRIHQEPHPYLRSDVALQEYDLHLTVMAPLPQLAILQQQGQTFFALLVLIGTLIVGIGASLSSYLGSIRHSRGVLLQQKERLDEAQHLAHLGSWELDLHTDLLSWSQETGHICEIDALPSTAGYAFFLSLIHPDDRPSVDQSYQEALAQRTPYHQTHRLLLADGRTRFVETRCETRFDADGRALRSIGTMQDVSERKAAEEEIHTLAFFDPLTKLPNRRLLLDRLRQCVSHPAPAPGAYQALLFLDLDNFKTLNDTLGHDVGDRMLMEVADRLRQSVHASDTISRLGGDEFVILLGHLSESVEDAAAQAAVIGDQLISRLAEPYVLGSHIHRSSASLGITLFCGNTVSVDEILKRADMAMYQAKSAGRNTLRFFDPTLQAGLNARLRMEQDLYRDLAQREFSLHYQPQVDAQGHCLGVEALVRWNHPQRGWISPLDFIPIAEDSGLIQPLGAWIMETACQQLVAWQAHPLTAGLSVSVNVSPRQFMRPSFVSDMIHLLHTIPLDPNKLVIEITESIFLDNLDAVVQKMAALQKYGLRFSLDDFGTGYSSLSYLKRLPLERVKIDAAFVHDILTDPTDAAISQAIIVLGRSLGLTLVAEGVETTGQWQLLQEQGCHLGQGYLFAKPMPAPALQAWLMAQAPASLTAGSAPV
ncbi:EAL domain-containing protein [Leptothrix ochracea]|uniref:bifunctional diguanylate cyclase/phosphodiesterase n=2 Tax=Leptothrix ochracea TaxID=735331 RepID=UPI0034E21D32